MSGQAKKEWDTLELQKDFTVKAFGHGVVFVTRKSDNVKGTLDFDHHPRKYYDFLPAG
tara:strand:- start:455 stop:628 length:174 start_codon:yes stop_codon:yes gene_type:complete